jgi:hypothetical protein
MGFGVTGSDHRCPILTSATRLLAPVNAQLTPGIESLGRDLSPDFSRIGIRPDSTEICRKRSRIERIRERVRTPCVRFKENFRTHFRRENDAIHRRRTSTATRLLVNDLDGGT